MAQALALDENFDLDVRGGPRLVRGALAAAGALYYRFSTFAGDSRANPGEWVYDYAYGVPWRTAVFGRYFQRDEIQAVLADTATRTTGVGPVAPSQVALTTNPETRRAQVEITRIPTLDGDTIPALTLPSEGP